MVWSTLLVVAVGVVLGVLVYRETGKRPRLEGDLEGRVLEIAEANEGRVTVPLIASRCGVSLEEGESLLDDLARDGHARMTIGEDGARIYEFAGLGDAGADAGEARLARKIDGIAHAEDSTDGAAGGGAGAGWRGAAGGASEGVARESVDGAPRAKGRESRGEPAALALIVDESGSMAEYEEAAVEGFNEFLREHRELEAGSATLTRTIFDDAFPPRTRHRRLEEAEPLSEASYEPGGNTALLDAVGHTIVEMRERFESLPESRRPSRVLMAIITDGEENASENYSESLVANLVRKCRRDGWEFLFVGAGLDEFADASGIGLSDDETYKCAGSAVGMREAYDEITEVSKSFRVPGEFRDAVESSTTTTGV